jgi:hypothetical protein
MNFARAPTKLTLIEAEWGCAEMKVNQGDARVTFRDSFVILVIQIIRLARERASLCCAFVLILFCTLFTFPDFYPKTVKAARLGLEGF